jgi:hypothetical protein
MIANILGICLTEQVGPPIALPVKAAIFTEQTKAGDMIEDLEKGKGDVAVRPNKNNNGEESDPKRCKKTESPK